MERLRRSTDRAGRWGRRRGTASSWAFLVLNAAILVFALLWVWRAVPFAGESGVSNGTRRSEDAGAEKAPSTPPLPPPLLAGRREADRVDDREDDREDDRDDARGPAGDAPETRAMPDAEPGENGDGGSTAVTSPLSTAADLRAVRAAERVIDVIAVELGVMRSVAGRYPTSSTDSGEHRGVEALFAALRTSRGFKLAIVSTGDTDGDGRPEILDPWGQPLVYFSAGDYGNGQSLGDRGTARGAHAGEGGTWREPDRFQLWSAGPNERNEDGGADDVTSWVPQD